MMYGIYMRASKQLPQEYIGKLLSLQVKREKRKAINNSYRLMNFSNVSISGQNEESFMINQLTVFVECERFKIPRIVKNYLLRNAR